MKPVDRLGDSAVDSTQDFQGAYPQVTSYGGSLALRLPAVATELLRTVGRFRQVTTSQLRRMHYQGSERGTIVRSARHLKRLYTLNLVHRVWGVYRGVPEYVYLPLGSKARNADPHTLDVTELYVRLTEKSPEGISRALDSSATSIIFDCEPWCHVQVGGLELKPDAYIEITTGAGRFQFFYECDRGTEFASQLNHKMSRYYAAYEDWSEPIFPLVYWAVPDTDRLRFVQKVIKQQPEPALFTASLFKDACSNIVSWGE